MLSSVFRSNRIVNEKKHRYEVDRMRQDRELHGRHKKV